MNAHPPPHETIVLQLYVAGHAPYSIQAQTNLKVILDSYTSPDSYQLEVVDVLETPLRALENQIFVTPTLVKVSPPPTGRIMGTLKERENVARMLGIKI